MNKREENEGWSATRGMMNMDELASRLKESRFLRNAIVAWKYICRVGVEICPVFAADDK